MVLIDIEPCEESMNGTALSCLTCRQGKRSGSQHNGFNLAVRRKAKRRTVRPISLVTVLTKQGLWLIFSHRRHAVSECSEDNACAVGRRLTA